MRRWYQPIACKLGFRTTSAQPQARRRLSVLPLEDRITPSGETFNLAIGTLGAGRSIQVTLDGTIDSVPKGIDRVWNLGAVSGTGFSTVATDDPAQSGSPAIDPTRTFVDRAPEVSAVFLRSSTWNSTFLTNLQNQGVGDSTFGYQILDGASQSAIAPWFNLDRISIRFNKNVTVSPTSLQLLGANAASYGLTGFTYDGPTNTATWTVTGGIDVDKLRLVLASSGVSAVTGGKALDGEWIDNTAVFPSGDGAAGGDFSFRFNVQPGDVNGDGVVNVTDGVVIRKSISGAPTSVIADLNGNGVVDINDFNLYRPRIGDEQPAGNPGGTPGSGWVASTTPIPPLPLGIAGTTITASKTASLGNDLNSNGLFDVGDTIHWTITITNTSGAAVTNIALFDGIDAHTTLVAGSVHAAPLANADSYTWAVNTRLDSAARGLPSLFANDTIANVVGGTDTIVLSGSTTITTTLGGSVTINATTGAFVYTPEAGDTGNDTFTYTIANSANPALTSTTTVTIGLGTQRVWYVQSGATNGDGRSSSPFNSPASASTAATGTDIIYVLTEFVGGPPPLNGNFTLENGQQLLGQGVSLTVNTVTLFTAGTRPTLTNTTGNVITLASGNTVQGLTLGNTSGVDVIGTAVGTFTMNTVSKSGTGRALDISTSGTLAVTFDNLTSTSSGGGAVVNLNGVGGTLTVTNNAGTDSSIASAAAGISIANAPVNASFSFGETVIGSSGTGINLTTNNAGSSILFASLAITTTAGAGFVASTGGQVALSGTTNTISATGGAAVDLASTTLTGGATFSTVSSSGSAGTGINLVNVTGALTANGGSIGTAAGDDVFISGGSSNVTIATNITNTAGHSVQVVSRAGGTVTISGTISDTGTGIRLFGNGSGTIAFTNATKTLHTAANTALNIDGNAAAVAMNFTNGGLDIATTTATAFLASGAGTLTVTGGTNSIVTSGAGAAMNVSGLTFGAGTTFLTVTSAGGTNNIALSNIAGSLTMSGGTLSGSTGTSFTLTGGNAAVSYGGTITVTNGQSGVVTSNPTGGSLTLGTVNVSNTGAANAIDAVVIDGNASAAFDVTITSATLNATNMNDALQLSDLVAGSDITISGGTLTAAATGDRVVSFATAVNANVNLSGVTLTGTNSDGIAFTSTVAGTYSFGSYTANTPNGGIALSVTAGVATITFASLMQSGGTSGVSITGATTGAVTINGGAISGTSGTDFNVNGGSANVTYAGTITNAAGNSVAVASHSGGTVLFSGAITDTAGSSGISLTSNGGATINFTGGLSLTTTTNAAFTATGGGTVTATQNNTTIVNTLTTTTATALNVANTLIGGSNLTFRSISSGAGANNGVVLDTTGASGGLIVTGNGAGITGGTISGKTGADGSTTSGIGIYLNSTSNVSLAHMDIEGNQNYGIRGNTVTGFTLDNSTVGITSTNGTSNTADIDAAGYQGEGGVRFFNLTGTAVISNSTLDRGFSKTLAAVNNTGTLTNFTIDNSILRNSLTATTSSDALYLEAEGSSTIANLTVQNNSQFTAFRQNAVQTNAQSGATMSIAISNSTFKNTNTSYVNASNTLVFNGTGANTFVTFDLNGNLLTQGDGVTDPVVASGGTNPGRIMTVGMISGAGTFYGKIRNNTFGTSGVVHSGSGNGADAIGFFAGGNNGSHGGSRLLVEDNTIQRYGQAGIQIGATGGNSTIDATIQGNTIRQPGTIAGGAFAGIWAYAGNAAGETNVLNIVIGSATNASDKNTLTDSDPNNSYDVFLGNVGIATAPINLYRNGSGAGSVNGATEAQVNAVLISDNNAGLDLTGNTVAPINLKDGVPALPPMLSASGGVSSDHPLPPATKLTTAEMVPIFAEAIHRMQEGPISRAMLVALRSATFQIVDLPAGYLGQAPLNGHVISLDVTADGYGWFVDPTPSDDSEFANAKSSTRFYTDSTLAPAGRMDLLTAVMHELGHVIGLDSSFNPNDREDLMYAYLTTGERRLPMAHAATDASLLAAFVGPLTVNPRSESPRFQTPVGNVDMDMRNSVSQSSKQSFEGSRSQTEFGNEGKVKATAWWMAPIELKKAKRQGPFVNDSEANVDA